MTPFNACGSPTKPRVSISIRLKVASPCVVAERVSVFFQKPPLAPRLILTETQNRVGAPAPPGAIAWVMNFAGHTEFRTCPMYGDRPLRGLDRRSDQMTQKIGGKPRICVAGDRNHHMSFLAFDSLFGPQPIPSKANTRIIRRYRTRSGDFHDAQHRAFGEKQKRAVRIRCRFGGNNDIRHARAKGFGQRRRTRQAFVARHDDGEHRFVDRG